MNKKTDICNCAICGDPTSVGLPVGESKRICFDCAEGISAIMAAMREYEKIVRSARQRRAAAERKKAC